MFVASHIWIFCKIPLTSIPLLQDHAPLCQILLLKLQNCTLHYIIWNPKMEMMSLFNYCDFLGSMFIFRGYSFRNSSHPLSSLSYSRQCCSRLWRSPGDAPLLWVVASVGDGHAALWEARKRCKKWVRETQLLEIHWEFHSFKKKTVQPNGSWRSLKNKHVFYVFFWWKRDLCITNNSQDCCIKHFIQSTQALVQHLKDRLVKHQSFRKS